MIQFIGITNFNVEILERIKKIFFNVYRCEKYENIV